MDLSIIPNYDEILTKLHVAWNAVQTSRSLRIVLIEGESGMKKSSLVQDFLQSSHVRCLIGHGSGIPISHLPLCMACESALQLDIVQEQLQKAPEDVSKEWRIALTEFAQVMHLMQIRNTRLWKLLAQWRPPALTPLTATDKKEEGGLAKFKPVNLPELFTRVVGELTRLSPLIVFFDKLDAADLSTIESFTRTIIPTLQDIPILFIATFELGWGERKATFGEIIETLQHISETEYLTLEPLQEEHIRRLLTSDACWWTDGLSDWHIRVLARQIRTLTGGNLAQVQDLLFWHEKNGEIPIHESLESIPDFGSFLQQKFAQVTNEERRFLQMAASQGVYFCLPVIEKVLEQAESALSPILSKVACKPGGWVGLDTKTSFGCDEFTWYQFLRRMRHDLVYNSIPEHVRPVYHQKIATALEEVYGDHVSAIVELLAMQFELARMRDKAALYQTMAAQDANEQGEFSKGLKYAQKGLESLGEQANIPENIARWCRLMIEKGRAMHITGQILMAENVLREAYQTSDDLSDKALRMDAGRHLGNMLLDRNNWDEGIHVIVQAITLAIEQKDWLVVIDGIEHLRDRFRRRGYIEEFFEICEMLIAKLNTEELESKSFEEILTGDENLEEILTRIEQQYFPPESDTQLTEQARVVLAEIFHSQGCLYSQLSENEKALEAFKKALQALEELEYSERYAQTYYKIHRGLAEVHLRTGNLPQSLQEIEEAMRWADASYQRQNQALTRSAKAGILQRMGRVEEGQQELEAALKMLRASPWLTTMGEIERDYGYFLYNTGYNPRARQLYQQSHDHYASVGDFDQMQRSKLYLATLDKDQGAFPKALAEYETLLNSAIAQNDKVGQSICRDRIGEIYRIQSRVGDAEQAHIKAIQLCDATQNMGGRAIALRSLGLVHLVNWNLKDAQRVFDQSDSLYQTHAGPRLQHHRTVLFLGRLALCQNKLSEAFEKLHIAQIFFETVQDLSWVSICALHQGLAYLVAGDAENALSKARYALELLKRIESWRIGGTYHLLARCYLATGQLEDAQTAIDQAETQLMNYKLFHRSYQAKNTEFAIKRASDASSLKKWQRVDLNELRRDFNCLGI